MSAAQQLPEQPSEPGTEIALLDRPLTAALVFVPGGVTSLLDALTAQVRATEIDVTTPKGRAACKSLAYKVSRSKTTLDQMGKDLDEELRARIKATNTERAAIRERLDALRDDVLKPVLEYEAEEEARVAELRRRLADLSWPAEQIAGLTIEGLTARLTEMQAVEVGKDWKEFRQKAADTLAREITLTTVALEEAQKREAEAARIAAEQAQAAEEARQEAERLQVERETRIAAEAAEAARAAAEREAEHARLLALEEAEARELAAQEAERTRLAKIEAEHRRQTEAAAQAERNRAAAVEAEHQRQVEAAEQVRRVAEREKLAAEQRAQRAEQERLAAEERAADAARQAEVDRVAAEDRAERQRLAAIAAERQRVADDLAAEQEAARRREADRAHKATVNNAAIAALMTHAGLGKDSAKAVVVAIATRQVPAIAISY